ncbi:MAG: hypothetical protein WBF58_12640 [Xanthobacteraceae bacterium]
MKLRAPPGVGDPCVGGVAIAPRDGLYDVEDDIGALLIECFGFVEVSEKAKAAPARAGAAPGALPPRRQAAPLPKLTHPAWRRPPEKKS